MEIRIKTTGYEMTADTSAYLNDKLEAISRLVGDDQTAHLDIEIGRSAGHSQQGDVWKAEFLVTRGSQRLRAIAEEESITAAIDIAKDEILQQLRKSKGKDVALTRRAGLKVKEWLRFGKRE